MRTTAYLLLILGLTISCELENRSGDFKLLPQPQEWKISGKSELNTSDLKYYHNAQAFPFHPEVIFWRKQKLAMIKTKPSWSMQ